MHLHSTSGSLKLGIVRAVIAFALVAATVSCAQVNQLARRMSSPVTHHAKKADDGYLRGAGGKLVDSTGRPVKLIGVSWFGFETWSCAPGGLTTRNWRDMLDQMRQAGFNVLRLPYSNQFLDDPTCLPAGIDYQTNPDLEGLRGLDLLDAIVNEAGRRGLKVILDRHSPTPDARTADLWYSEQVPESRWISDWVMLARHYLGNRAVVGADIANEPHGSATWGDGNGRTDWRLAAETAGNAILAANPNLLILVQGIQYYNGDQYWWGGQLKGAAVSPVRLSRPDKLVYSPHDYGPSVAQQAWFRAADFPHNLRQVWDTHWGNLQQQGVPLVLGEFSARSVGNDYEGIWQRSLMSYLGERGIGAIYWAWNPDSADTDGMLQGDWTTINQPELDAMMGRQPSVSKSGSASPGVHQSGQVCHQPARPDAHIDGCT